MPGHTPSFIDFSSYQNDAELVGQALLSDKVLDRYLLSEVDGHRLEAIKYINEDYAAVMQRGHYEETIEFAVDDLDKAPDGFFKFIYWGKSHAGSDTIIENSERELNDMGEPLNLFSPSKSKFESLPDGWARLTANFYVPDGVNLVRTFGLVRRQGFWDRERPNLRERLAHLVGLIMRRAVGDASVAFRVSFV